MLIMCGMLRYVSNILILNTCFIGLQFGFKQKTGCSDAGVISNVVYYYTQNGSKVSVAALDMSKAFDKVNYFGLFINIKLLNGNIFVSFIKVLINWYSKVVSRVR